MTKEKVIRGFRELRKWQKDLPRLKLLDTTQNAAINRRHEKFQVLNLCSDKALMMSAKEIDNAPLKIPAKILKWRLFNEKWWEE